MSMFHAVRVRTDSLRAAKRVKSVKGFSYNLLFVEERIHMLSGFIG
jgi:hypothetical protein